MALEFKGEWQPLDMTIMSQELDFLREKSEHWVVERCDCKAFVLTLPATDWLSVHTETITGVKHTALAYYQHGEEALRAVFTSAKEFAKRLMRERQQPNAAPTPTITKTA